MHLTWTVLMDCVWHPPLFESVNSFISMDLGGEAWVVNCAICPITTAPQVAIDGNSIWLCQKFRLKPRPFETGIGWSVSWIHWR